MIRLVLFDIDGTLIRTGGAGVRAFARTFACAFGRPEATAQINFSGRTDVSLVREVFTREKIEPSPENFARFFDQYPFWLDHFLHQLDGGPCEGVPAFLKALAGQGNHLTLGLLTGNIRLGAELKLRRYELWRPFRTGAFADDHENRNDIARIARARANRLAGRPLAGEEIIVIGDTPLDIECGHAIGARVLAVGTGQYTAAQLAAFHPAWAVPTLEALPVEQILA